jgi:hypothetical protein
MKMLKIVSNQLSHNDPDVNPPDVAPPTEVAPPNLALGVANAIREIAENSMFPGPTPMRVPFSESEWPAGLMKAPLGPKKPNGAPSNATTKDGNGSLSTEAT